MGSLAETRLRRALERVYEVTRGREPVGLNHDDADEIEGTIACDDAIGFDPLPLLHSLEQHGADVVIIGQVAGILHGSTELTGDLDLIWSGIPTDAMAVRAGFAAVDAVLTDDNGRQLAAGVEAFSLPKVQFRCETAAGDCCTPALPWGQLDIEGIIGRADSAVIDGARLRYVSRPDLIAMRGAAGRPKDVRRARELERLGL